MDNSRMNTIEAGMAGVFERPTVKCSRPKDANLKAVSEGDWSESDLRIGIEKGGLHGNMYYGIWSIWRDANGYSGELHQYRNLTDHFEAQLLEFALVKAVEWATGCEG